MARLILDLAVAATCATCMFALANPPAPANSSPLKNSPANGSNASQNRYQNPCPNPNSPSPRIIPEHLKSKPCHPWAAL